MKSTGRNQHLESDKKKEQRRKRFDEAGILKLMASSQAPSALTHTYSHTVTDTKWFLPALYWFICVPK